MNNKNVIIKVEKDSIAHELEISPGDVLVSIDNKEIKDIFDYRYLIKNDYIELFIKKHNDDEIIFEIEKDYEEDLGIVFEQGLMDNAKRCNNKCIFCFIDQLPKGMRETLYFKDDDSRLSFLQGNYVTLTNMSEEDLDRIIFYHLSPINVSVHATDLELRHFMLKNPKSKNIIPMLEKIHKANISMNFQVVLVKGVNDRDNLDKTILDLSKYIKNGESLSIVPIGITKYREGLYDVAEFTKDDCAYLIDQVEAYQEKFLKENDTRFVYVSDEFYIMAERTLPSLKKYEDFPQHENGVGMITLMEDEFTQYLETIKADDSLNQQVSIVTGTLASGFINTLKDRLNIKFPNININVFPITNQFFGHKITISGLLTGQDIINQLNGKDLGDRILIPENAFMHDETIFLDDVTLIQIEEELHIRAIKVETTGFDFINQIINLQEDSV